MKTICRDFLTAFVMGLVVPAGLLMGFVALGNRKAAPVPVTEATQTLQASGRSMRLRSGDSVAEMELNTYIVGVVLAEMPVEFEPEALKAQAVAARTYTQKAYETGGKHGDGSVCRDASCCQAYISQEDYLKSGGTGEGLEKAAQAVEATQNLVLTYEGDLIEATYFSCSGGTTEDAVAVWGTDYPYLRSVDSPGEEEAAYFRDTVRFTPEEFQKALGLALEGDPADWFGLTEYTSGGGVETMEIGGEVFTGVQLRALLGLRSAAFTVEAAKTQIQITTKGYGHRVGMSQYGAEAMAVAGSSYVAILAHYYPGTVLTPLGIDS